MHNSAVPPSRSSRVLSLTLWELSLAYFINPICCPFPHIPQMEVTRNYLQMFTVSTHSHFLSLYCLATHNEPQMLVFMGFSIAYHLHGCYQAPCSRRSHFLITSCTLMDRQVSALPPFCAFRS